MRLRLVVRVVHSRAANEKKSPGHLEPRVWRKSGGGDWDAQRAWLPDGIALMISSPCGLRGGRLHLASLSPSSYKRHARPLSVLCRFDASPHTHPTPATPSPTPSPQPCPDPSQLAQALVPMPPRTSSLVLV